MDDALEVVADDAEAAARGWARWSDSHTKDRAICREKESPTVQVQGKDSTNTYVIRGWIAPLYMATQK